MKLDVNLKLADSIEYAVKFSSEAKKELSGKEAVRLTNSLEALLKFSDEIRREAAKPAPVKKKRAKKKVKEIKEVNDADKSI